MISLDLKANSDVNHHSSINHLSSGKRWIWGGGCLLGKNGLDYSSLHHLSWDALRSGNTRVGPWVAWLPSNMAASTPLVLNSGSGLPKWVLQRTSWKLHHFLGPSLKGTQCYFHHIVLVKAAVSLSSLKESGGIQTSPLDGMEARLYCRRGHGTVDRLLQLLWKIDFAPDSYPKPDSWVSLRVIPISGFQSQVGTPLGGPGNA